MMMILKVITVHPQGNTHVKWSRHFTQNHKCHNNSSSDSDLLVGRTPDHKKVQIHPLGIIQEHNFMTIHQTVVEIFPSGLNW